MEERWPKYYSWNGETVQEIIDRWVEYGDKIYDKVNGYLVPIEYILPYREYDWTRERTRGGAVPDICYQHETYDWRTQTGQQVEYIYYDPGPDHWDALVEYMARCGWTRDPAHMLIGKNGIAKLGEGNHRVNVANWLGLDHVPVLFHFHQEVEYSKMSPFKNIHKKYRFDR
jgi:hypothetical protein